MALQMPNVDNDIVEKIVDKLKSQGIFDQFRKDCLADVDSRPAYQNLRDKVNGAVASFLSRQRWSDDLNKNIVRDSLRRHVTQGSCNLEAGVNKIVEQVVNPKIYSVIMPKVEDVVCEVMGIEKPNNTGDRRLRYLMSSISQDTSPKKNNSLLPSDLDPVSPGSINESGNESANLNDSITSNKIVLDEDNVSRDVNKESNFDINEASNDSKLTGISELSSHGSTTKLDISESAHLPGDKSEICTSNGPGNNSNVGDKTKAKSINEPSSGSFDFDNFSNLKEKLMKTDPLNKNVDKNVKPSPLVKESENKENIVDPVVETVEKNALKSPLPFGYSEDSIGSNTSKLRIENESTRNSLVMDCDDSSVSFLDKKSKDLESISCIESMKEESQMSTASNDSRKVNNFANVQLSNNNVNSGVKDEDKKELNVKSDKTDKYDSKHRSSRDSSRERKSSRDDKKYDKDKSRDRYSSSKDKYSSRSRDDKYKSSSRHSDKKTDDKRDSRRTVHSDEKSKKDTKEDGKYVKKDKSDERSSSSKDKDRRSSRKDDSKDYKSSRSDHKSSSSKDDKTEYKSSSSKDDRNEHRSSSSKDDKKDRDNKNSSSKDDVKTSDKKSSSRYKEDDKSKKDNKLSSEQDKKDKTSGEKRKSSNEKDDKDSKRRKRENCNDGNNKKEDRRSRDRDDGGHKSSGHSTKDSKSDDKRKSSGKQDKISSGSSSKSKETSDSNDKKDNQTESVDIDRAPQPTNELQFSTNILKPCQEISVNVTDSKETPENLDNHISGMDINQHGNTNNTKIESTLSNNKVNDENTDVHVNTTNIVTNDSDDDTNNAENFPGFEQNVMHKSFNKLFNFEKFMKNNFGNDDSLLCTEKCFTLTDNNLNNIDLNNPDYSNLVGQCTVSVVDNLMDVEANSSNIINKTSCSTSNFNCDGNVVSNTENSTHDTLPACEKNKGTKSVIDDGVVLNESLSSDRYFSLPTVTEDMLDNFMMENSAGKGDDCYNSSDSEEERNHISVVQTLKNSPQKHVESSKIENSIVTNKPSIDTRTKSECINKGEKKTIPRF